MNSKNNKAKRFNKPEIKPENKSYGDNSDNTKITTPMLSHQTLTFRNLQAPRRRHGIETRSKLERKKRPNRKNRRLRVRDSTVGSEAANLEYKGAAGCSSHFDTHSHLPRMISLLHQQRHLQQALQIRNTGFDDPEWDAYSLRTRNLLSKNFLTYLLDRQHRAANDGELVDYSDY